MKRGVVAHLDDMKLPEHPRRYFFKKVYKDGNLQGKGDSSFMMMPDREPLYASSKYIHENGLSSLFQGKLVKYAKSRILELYTKEEISKFYYNKEVHDQQYISKYKDKDFKELNPMFEDISRDPMVRRKYMGRVYFISFSRDLEYINHEELSKIGPRGKERKVEYIGATKNFGRRMYNRIKNAICYPKPSRKPSIKNALLEAFEMIGLDVQMIRESWRKVPDTWGLVQDIIKILEDFGFIFEVIEYQERYESAFSREVHWIKEKNTLRNGLNQVPGGGGMGKIVHIPLYDIAMLISLGASLKQITEYINSEYKDYYKRLVHQNSIKEIIKYEWGSFYDAQELLLRPVIEDLAINKNSLKEIFLALRSADVRHGWFEDFYVLRGGNFDWDRVKFIAEEDRDHLLGITISQWLEWGARAETRKSIARLAGLTIGLVDRATSHLSETVSTYTAPAGYSGKFSYFIHMVRRAFTIKSIFEQCRSGKDVSLVDIYTSNFRKQGERIRRQDVLDSILSLFPGMTLDQIIKEFSYPLITDWSKHARELFFEIPSPIFSYLLDGFWGDAILLKLVFIRNGIDTMNFKAP